jgi:hypothetical protein
MKKFYLCLVVIALATPSFGNDKKAKAEEEPTVFGMMSQNVGCVIFKQYINTNTKFWGVAISQKKVGVLEVIETQNYDMEQKKWTEDQDSMDQLLRIGVKDKVKFVKIPEKYTPNQLEKARSACKDSAITPGPEKKENQ